MEVMYLFTIGVHLEFLSSVSFDINMPYDKKEEVPSIDTLEKLLEEKFFIPRITPIFEGILEFEKFDYFGEEFPLNEYSIGSKWFPDIYEVLKYKKVRIEDIEYPTAFEGHFNTKDHRYPYTYKIGGIDMDVIFEVLKNSKVRMKVVR
jgi:hypothetical protein